VVEDLEKSDW